MCKSLVELEEKHVALVSREKKIKDQRSKHFTTSETMSPTISPPKSPNPNSSPRLISYGC